MNIHYTAALDAMSKLEDNWDNDGAPHPSIGSLLLARFICEYIEREHGFDIYVSPDVCGGVGVFVSIPGKVNDVWVIILNDAPITVSWRGENLNQTILIKNIESVSQLVHFFKEVSNASDD